MKRSPEIRYAIIQDDVASLLQESIYIPYTLKLWVPLSTYDTMLIQSRYNGLRKHIGSRKIMHDTLTSIQSIRCLVNTKKIMYNTMHLWVPREAWAHVAHPHPCPNDGKME